VSEEPKQSALEQEKIAEKERVRKAREAAEGGRDVLFVENLGEVASEARHDLEAAKILAATGRDRAPARLILPDQYSSQKNPSGYAPSLQNTILAVAELKIKCRHDVFHNKILFEGHPSLDGDFENVCLVIRQLIAQQKQFEPSKETMVDAVTRIALEYQFNPVLDYLDGLKWDGQKRIDTWLTEYLGAEDTPLHRAMGRKWLLAAVRRVREPGCKFDTIPTLEGPQGSLKSTLVRELAGGRENFSDADILQSDKREQQELCEGVWEAKPPVYLVTEIDVTNPEAYGKEFAPKAQASIKASGGKFVVIGGAGGLEFGGRLDWRPLSFATIRTVAKNKPMGPRD
jgi:hypothetical protein